MAENAVYQTEKLLKEQGEKIGADRKAKVQAAVDELKQAVKENHPADMKAKLEALNTEVQSFTSELYSKAKEGREGGAGCSNKTAPRRLIGLSHRLFPCMEANRASLQTRLAPLSHRGR